MTKHLLLEIPKNQDKTLYILSCQLKEKIIFDECFPLNITLMDGLKTIIKDKRKYHFSQKEPNDHDIIRIIIGESYEKTAEILIPFIKKSITRACMQSNHGKSSSDPSYLIDHKTPLTKEAFLSLSQYLNLNDRQPIFYKSAEKYYFAPDQEYLLYAIKNKIKLDGSLKTLDIKKSAIERNFMSITISIFIFILEIVIKITRNLKVKKLLIKIKGIGVMASLFVTFKDLFDSYYRRNSPHKKISLFPAYQVTNDVIRDKVSVQNTADKIKDSSEISNCFLVSSKRPVTPLFKAGQNQTIEPNNKKSDNPESPSHRNI
jgi:hypothetical protein